MQETTEASKIELLKKSINIALNILKQELSSRQLKDDSVFPSVKELDKLVRQFSFDYKSWADVAVIDAHVKSRLLFLIEAAKSYLEKSITPTSGPFIDFKKTVIPADIWRLIFSLMTKIDLAMLLQASKYFKNQVDVFKKNNNYRPLSMDHGDYLLPPRRKELAIAKDSAVKSLLAISPNHFHFLLGFVPYIYDTISDRVYPLFAQDGDKKILFSDSNDYDEFYLGLVNKTVAIYRLDKHGTYVKLQILAVPDHPDLPIFIKVVSKDRFIIYNPAAVNLYQKKHDGMYSLTRVWEDCSITRYIEVINDQDLLMQRTFLSDESRKLETSILRQNSKGEYTKIQSLDISEEFVLIRINLGEFLLHQRSLTSKIAKTNIWKKNASNLYEDVFEKKTNGASVTVLRNEDLLLYSNILATYEKSSGAYHVDRVTRIETTATTSVQNAFVAEDSSGNLLFVNFENLCVKRAKSNRVDFLAKLVTSVERHAINSSGNMLINDGQRTTYLFFRNSNRVFKKFAAPNVSAESVLKRLEKAILFSQHGATDKGELSFLTKRVLRVNDKDITVHPIMADILNRMTEAKNSIARTSAVDKDRIYSCAITDIKTIIMNYKGETVKSRLYLFRKLIEEFEQNRAAHADDIVDETVAFAS